jgi:bacillithiol system protein YtxJ
LDNSNQQSLLIFKHSTRCPISAAAHLEVEAYLSDSPNAEVTYGLIYVVEDREVSNEAAERLNVQHESPQVVLVKNGQSVWNTSHSAITSNALKGILN